MEIVICVVLSMFASVVTTRFLTLRYFEVIDDYVKGLVNDVKNSFIDAINSVSDTAGRE